ncbi:MAG TPA: CapA family protein [Lachnospiraceae bacterium]|nr:CapA family protein [Lachnospiraceae bacterium]
MRKKQLYAMGAFMVFTLIILIVVVTNEIVSYRNYREEQDVLVTGSNTVVSDASTIENGSTSATTDSTTESQKPDNAVTKDDQDSETSVNENNVTDAKDSSLEENISLAFTGDVLLSSSPLNKYDSAGGIHGILSDKLLEEMNGADIMMINQEFPFSTRGTQMQDKQYTFRTDPSRVGILHEMGVDIVSLANNHTLDFGVEAMLDTLQTLKNEDIKSVGAGENLEQAKETVYLDVKGKTIAFLGASRVIPVYEWNATDTSPGLFTTYDPTALLEEIRSAKEKSDLAVVYVHWGIEKQSRPEEYQRTMAKQYIDAGADIVIGSHPHVLQGIEFYKGKPIIYSLGNFIFGDRIDQTALLKVNMNKDNSLSLSLLPCRAYNSLTKELRKVEDLQNFYDMMESISYDTSIDSEGNVLQLTN